MIFTAQRSYSKLLSESLRSPWKRFYRRISRVAELGPDQEWSQEPPVAQHQPSRPVELNAVLTDVAPGLRDDPSAVPAPGSLVLHEDRLARMEVWKLPYGCRRRRLQDPSCHLYLSLPYVLLPVFVYKQVQLGDWNSTPHVT